jgi:glycosyltransferase involved in cell wall biosynthesis
LEEVPRLIDLSRLASRLGRGPPTGIDRVERAYLGRLMAQPDPLFALVRSGPGFCLLDREGARSLAVLAEGGGPLPAPDLLARLSRRDPRLAAADTAVRARATARAAVPFLAAMLRRRLPAGTRYLNIGHANLTDRVLGAMRAGPGGRVAVFVHDVIPLDHPELSRPDRIAAFHRRIAAAARGADLAIYNSAHTRERAEAWFARFGRVPAGLVAPLGVVPARPDPAALPLPLRAAAEAGRPFFLCLGTIEPRKNHALLLEVWDRLAARLPAARLPRLVVAGGRGWAAPGLFARLEAAVRDGAVIEAPGLADGAVAALLDRAAALLFPSLAEGFGLPVAEAMAAGCPVLCSPLPALRETAGHYPVYLDPTDPYAWEREIERCAARDRGGREERRANCAAASPRPGWDSHFNRVLSAI